MGCGLSLFRKPANNSIPESNLEAALKPSVFNNTTESVPVNTDQSIEEATDFGNDDVDDYEKELQQLNDDKGGVEDMTSPPPTLDESMSDHGSPPLPIAATVTLKTLESPRSVIFTSTSRPTSSGGLVSSPLREFTTGSSSNIVETNQLVDEQPQAASPSEDYSSEPPAFDEVANEVQDAAVNVESTNEEPQENEETTGEEIADPAAENDQLNSIMETTEDEVNNSDQNDEEAPIETSNEGLDEQEKEEELQLTNGDEIGTTNSEGELLANEEIEDQVDKIDEEASPTVVVDAEESEDINPTESREDEVREESFIPEEDQVADPTLDQEQETKDEVELNVETSGNEEEVPIEEESSPVDEITPEEESAKEIEPEIAEESEMTENNDEPHENAQDDNNINNEENIEGDANDNQQPIENEIQHEEIDGDVTVDTPKEEEIPNTEEDNAIASQAEDLSNPQVDEGGELEVTDNNIEAVEDEQLNVDADAPAEDLDQELPESNEEPAQEEIVLEVSEMPIIESEEITAVKDELQEKSDLDTGEQPNNDVEVENAEEQETLNDENLTDAAIITDEMTDQDGLVDDQVDETAAQKDDENPDELVNSTEVDQLVGEDATETELQPEIDEGVENTVAQDTADQPAEDEPNLTEEQIPEEENTNNDPDANDAIEATNFENVAENVTEEATDDLSNDIGTDEGAQGDIVAFEDSQQESEANNEVTNDTEIDDNVFETAEESQAPEQVDESTEPTEDDGKPENEKETTADQDFNQIFDDGDQEASNDDEEEIWRKLQKDIQLEEEEQLQLAATRIQSTFRGYKTRKELKQQLSRQQDVEEGTDDQDVDDITAVEDQQEVPPAEESDSVLEDGEQLTEALAGITETVASVALFMADSPNDEFSRPRRSADDYNQENDDGSSIVAACPNEVNDVKEEPLSNGEEVNDVQLINTYVIQTGRGLEETQNVDETEIELPSADSQDNLETENEEMKETETKEDNPTEATDPELVFELYVESNETTNDGLLQSCWQDNLKDLSSDSFDPNVLNTYEYEMAATKIQAGYRGYRDRKLMKTNENQTNNSQNETGVVGSEEVSTNPLSSQEENAAAIKIQAGYRGHRDRKRVKDLKDDKVVEQIVIEEPDLCSIDSQNAAATKIQASFRGHRERQQLKRCRSLNDGNKPEETPPLNGNQMNESNLSNSESELERENAAATKIQAGFRGHRDRERVEVLQNTAGTENSKASAGADECWEDSTVFVNDKTSDLTNNSTEEFLERENAAATKIQAGFRGHRDRERVKNLQNNIGVENRKSAVENEGCEDSTLCLNNESTDPTNNLTDELLERENAAATKIQAGFRGHRDRERVKGIQSLQTKNPADCTEPKDSVKVDFDALSSIFDERHNAAAIKIQSGYRGYRERKNLKRSNSVGANYGRYSILSSDDFCDFYRVRRDSLPHIQPSTEFTRIIRRRDSAPNFNFVDFENEEYDCDPDSEQEKAAIKIQSNFRGYRVRKERKIQQGESQINPTENCTESLPEAQDDDAENQAAIKIQAGYRGYRTRKNIHPKNV